jgi:CubicO group peptidase (beta-lactamase class C family)
MKNIRLISLITLIVLPLSGLSAQEKQLSVTEKLDAYYQQALTDWGVPGMAVAIIKDNEIVLMKGYGVKEINKGGKVDEETIFAIASLSKAFTSAALAVLVDEGKIEWDDKVRQHLPWFEMYNPYVTENMTIRDLLCHRSGLKTFSGDLLWFESSYSRDDIIRRAKYLEPTYGFRSDFGYSNIMFLVAGEVVKEVSGQSWDEFVETRFFEPLGMKNTSTSIKKLKGEKNVASPHTVDYYSDETVAVPYMNWDNIAAAGGINSNVKDYANWIKLHLNSGVFNNDTIFSPIQSWEMWASNTPQFVSKGSASLWPSTHFKSYGLGWGISDYMGKKIVTHGGGTDGMTCYTALVPEENLGFVILTNKYSSMYYALTYQTLDAFLNKSGKESDWSKTLLRIVNRNIKNDKEEAEKAKESIVSGTKPSLELKKYVGTYGGDLYGNAEVRLLDDELLITLIPAPKLTSKLKHLQYDTFTIKFNHFPGLPEGTVNFIINAKGEVEELRIDVPNPDFDFTELKFIKKV